jgi:hypothetical protein
MSYQGLFDPLWKNSETIPYVPWKPKSQKQIVSSIQQNARYQDGIQTTYPPDTVVPPTNLIAMHKSVNQTHVALRPLPLKHYRRELSVVSDEVDESNCNGCSERTSSKIDVFNQPGGYLVNPDVDEMSRIVGIPSTLEMKARNVKTNLPPGCHATLDRNGVCFDAGANALKRVRSAGMIVKKSAYVAPFSTGGSNPANPDKAAYNAPFSTSMQQYMYSRGRTFTQNQSHILKSGSLVGGDAVFAITTPIPFDNSCAYLPTYYKPNNQKFAQEGAVTTSARLTRLKYDTVTTNGGLYSTALGSAVGNAMAYNNISPNPYSLKEKIGYPLTKYPIFPKYGKDKMCCTPQNKIHNPI